MADVLGWESVQHAKPTDELLKLVGEANSFAAWPAIERHNALISMNTGVRLGHVAEGYDAAAIVGTVSICSNGLEFRARWSPPA